MHHILLHCLPAWGHLKPLTALMVLMAELRPDVVLTLPTCVQYQKVLEELSRIPKDRLEKVRDRIHIIHVPNPRFPETFLSNPDMNVALAKLWRGEDLTCITSGKVFSGLPKPSLIILDFLAGAAFDVLRSLDTNRTVPIISWNSSLIGPTIHEFGPESLGGKGNVPAKIQSILNETPGGDPSQVTKDVLMDIHNKVVHVPGYPPMYDYEWFPQDVDLSVPLAVLGSSWKVYNESDGSISASARFLEEKTIDAVQKYFQAAGKTLIAIGFPSSITVATQQSQEVRESNKMTFDFLDKIHKEVGEKSLIYISFGSHFWPPQPSKLSALVEELIRSRTPFLLGRGSPVATLPPSTLAKVSAYSLGLVLDWTPQEDILQHPATGWFLTHGGWNSTQEAIQNKVPLIFYPISADQPLIASFMTLTHRVGFELISVRSGVGAKTPYHLREQEGEGRIQFDVDAVRMEVRQLLQKLHSREGEEVRSRMEKLGDKVPQLWVDGGEANVALSGFLKQYLK